MVQCIGSSWIVRRATRPSVNDEHHTTSHHNRFTALFPGPPGWAGARRELLDLMVQGKINRGRHTDHPAGRHSIRTNQCAPPPSPHGRAARCRWNLHSGPKTGSLLSTVHTVKKPQPICMISGTSLWGHPYTPYWS